MQPHTIDTRWVKIHSVRKILVFSIFHITSLFLCVTLRLRASALKSTAVCRFTDNPKGVLFLWCALLTHLIMRYIKFKSRAVCSYSRFVAFVRAVTWLKKDIIQSLWFYGMEREKNSSVSSHFRAEDKAHDQNHATLQNSLIHK